MLPKSKAEIKPTVAVLEELLTRKNLSPKQKELIEDELWRVRAGAQGEREAAYHIDFKLKDTKNWAVIHDLRLEYNGRVAQIDHLLIGRMFDIFVIESKNVKTALRVNDGGEFEVKTRWGWKGMASPVEQNKRHIQVLSELISDHSLTPTRLGFRIRPTFHNWVLLAPECNLSKGAGSKEATILKMDLFDRGLEDHINNTSLVEMVALAKICSVETLTEFAQKLIGFHRPASFDYAAKFGISASAPVEAMSPEKTPAEPARMPLSPVGPVCGGCGVSVEQKVINFCRLNTKRFGEKVLCRTCQTSPVGPAASPVATMTTAPAANIPPAVMCHQCQAPVDAKVVAFCRFNSRRFEKRILCRTCQINPVPAGG